jgi:hypothetical protein
MLNQQLKCQPDVGYNYMNLLIIIFNFQLYKNLICTEKDAIEKNKKFLLYNQLIMLKPKSTH